MTQPTTATVTDRIDALDWAVLEQRLDEQGFAVTDPVLDAGECSALADLFDSGSFRSTIDMARHRFGDGRYRYFAHPLPETVQAARAAFYAHLAPVANRWADLLSGTTRRSRPPTKSCCSAAARRVRSAPHRCCCATTRATGTRCTRTSTATCTSPSRS